MSATEKVDRIFERLDRPGMPGAAVAVLSGGEVVHRKGYGLADLDRGVSMMPETSFAIASMTKQFTTTCILLLEEEGRLSLEDDIRKHLPEMPDFGSPVTIDHLCTNTSGIRDIFPAVSLAGGWRLDPRPRELVAEILGRQRTLNFPTGSQYRYSNPNFQVLSWIIEKITGQRLGEVMTERIFEPLGMADTFLQDLRDEPVSGGARGYDGGNPADLTPTAWEAFARAGCGEGGGAIWSTLDDLIRWEKNFSHNAIGSPNFLDRLPCPPEIPGGGESIYGRGLFVGSHRGLAWHGHSGGLGAYASNRIRFPDRDLSVIMLSNSALADPYLAVFDVADVLLDEDPRLPPAPVFDRADAEAVRPWFGAYEDPESGLSFALGDDEGTAVLTLFGTSVPLETNEAGELLALRGGSLPTAVILGAALPEPRITLRLGPNPPIHLVRSLDPTDGLELFAGDYVSDEFVATHSVEPAGDGLSVTIDGQLGRREDLPLERQGPTSFVAAYDHEQRALYHFRSEPGRPPTELVVSINRCERVRFRRAGDGGCGR